MADVVISGLGVVSPLGTTLDELVGRAPRSERPALHDGPMVVHDVPLDLVPADKRNRIGRLDRLSRFFLAAAYLAIDDAHLDPSTVDSARFGLSFGTGLGCLLTDEEYYRRILEKGLAAASPQLFAYTVSSAAAGEISIAMGIKGPNCTSHMGFAAGAGALGYAADWIRNDKADVVLAGGADVIGPALVEGLADMALLKEPTRCVPWVSEQPGVRPSEAAVVFVLESSEHAERRRARIRGTIEGWAAGFEPTLTRRNVDALGISATLRAALADGFCAPAAVDTVYCSAHGTPIDAVELRALHDVFGAAVPRLIASKSLHGECFGASGVMAAALAITGLPPSSPPLPPWERGAGGEGVRGTSDAGLSRGTGEGVRGTSDAGLSRGTGEGVRGTSDAGLSRGTGEGVRGTSDAGLSRGTGEGVRGTSDAGLSRGTGEGVRGTSDAGLSRGTGEGVRGEGEGRKVGEEVERRSAAGDSGAEPAGEVILVSSVCYSGNVVGLVLSRA